MMFVCWCFRGSFSFDYPAMSSRMARANYAPMQQRLLDDETAFAALPV